ncbi:AAA family ATPase [Streptomyces phaeochromogenes]|uniref:AAA family ATPase n=1 Tax=Streptomyces phaeochromogenes TaxID=1923 RepID=UPI0033C84F1C
MHPDNSASGGDRPAVGHAHAVGANADGTTLSAGESGARPTPATASHSSRWWIYCATGRPLYDVPLNELLPPPPPWRRFSGAPVVAPPPSDDEETERRLGRSTAPTATPDELRRELDMVNAALYLRRPLLVTGKPGTGKSSLAYRISKELRLGRVLRWHITSRTTLRSGLYEYDAIGRVQDSAALRTLHHNPADATARQGEGPESQEATLPGIGEYLQLGPLGTALLPYAGPRVLLIDELDKSDQDLANDLLSVFEEGQFPITELVRARSRHPRVKVLTDDPRGTAEIVDGVVTCRAFPIVVITSNGEREFPPAFLRRCLRLEMPDPGRSQLVDMVMAHLGEGAVPSSVNDDLISRFLERSRDRGGLAMDQLLNAAFLAASGRFPQADEGALQELVDALWHRLDGAGAESRSG